MPAPVFFSKLWKTIYKQPVNRLKEERFLKRRLAFAASIKQNPTVFDKEIIIIRTDDIGDYILFRNTLHELKKYFPGYKITLMGHQLWKPIAESLDGDAVYEFIWLDKKAFNDNEEYVTGFLREISNKKPEWLIAPSYSRNPFIDDIIATVIPAKQKWGWQRSIIENKRWMRAYVDKAYTNLIPIPTGLHEFDLNKYIMETFARNKFAINKPAIDAAKLPFVTGIAGEYIILFPGAAAKRKRWDTAYFAQVADYVSEQGLKSVICGAKNDNFLAQEIINKAKNKGNIINYTSKTDLMQLAAIINNCRLIVTNDTSAAHFAAALNKQTIVLVNGNSYGRFFPYPATLNPNIKFFYSPALNNIPYDWAGMGDIQDIKPEKILQYMREILN